MRKYLLLSMMVLAGSAIGYQTPAPDITGKWVADVPGRNGTTQMTFDLQVNGKKLTGTVSGLAAGGGGRRGGGGGGGGGANDTAPTDHKITNGKINGNKVSFDVEITRGENVIVTSYKGTFDNDQLKLKQTRDTGRGGPQSVDIVATRGNT